MSENKINLSIHIFWLLINPIQTKSVTFPWHLCLWTWVQSMLKLWIRIALRSCSHWKYKIVSATFQDCKIEFFICQLRYRHFCSCASKAILCNKLMMFKENKSRLIQRHFPKTILSNHATCRSCLKYTSLCPAWFRIEVELNMWPYNTFSSTDKLRTLCIHWKYKQMCT